MRLINADKLKPNAQWSDFYETFRAYSITQVDDAPTVEAIPVEWLLMARDKYNNHGLPKEANFINELIALWGICNETD